MHKIAISSVNGRFYYSKQWLTVRKRVWRRGIQSVSRLEWQSNGRFNDWQQNDSLVDQKTSKWWSSLCRLLFVCDISHIIMCMMMIYSTIYLACCSLRTFFLLTQCENIRNDAIILNYFLSKWLIFNFKLIFWNILKIIIYLINLCIWRL